MPPDDDDLPAPAPSDAVSAPPAAHSDLRAKDVLTRSAAELEELERSLDPAVRAELESWFARPSAMVVEEQVEAEAAPSPGLQLGFGDGMDAQLAAEAAARKKRVEAAAAVIYPWMYDLLERHQRYDVRPIVPPAPVLDTSILAVAIPGEEEMATIGEPREYGLSREIEAALADAAPQAVLRDLYRPETEFTIQLTAPEEEGDQPTDGHREVLAALDWRPEPVERLALAASARTAHAEFREITAPPWPETVAAAKAIRHQRRSS